MKITNRNKMIKQNKLKIINASIFYSIWLTTSTCNKFLEISKNIHFFFALLNRKVLGDKMENLVSIHCIIRVDVCFCSYFLLGNPGIYYQFCSIACGFGKNAKFSISFSLKIQISYDN